jgi:hypothetical protein
MTVNVASLRINVDMTDLLRAQTALNGLGAATQNAGRRAGDMQAQQQALINTIREQAAVVGRGVTGLLEYRAAQLGVSDAVRQEIATLRQYEQQQQAANDAAKKGADVMGMLKGAIGGVTSAFGVMKAVDYIKDAALLAARYETLGVVMTVVGKNIGLTADQMERQAQAIAKQGITMNESRQSLIQMAQAHIDLSKATDLARIAQNAAVIGQINSSEAFGRMVTGLQQGDTVILRGIGLQTNFETAYQRTATQLKKNVAQLTENEKMQARMNEVIRAGVDINGVYEASLGTAGKQLLSAKRYTEDFKNMVGETFNTALTVGVNAFTDHLKESNKEIRELKEKGELKGWGDDFARILAWLADRMHEFVGGIKLMAGAVGVLLDTAKNMSAYRADLWENKFSFKGQFEAADRARERQTAIVTGFRATMDEVASGEEKFTDKLNEFIFNREQAEADSQFRRLKREQEYYAHVRVIQQAYAKDPKRMTSALEELYQKEYVGVPQYKDTPAKPATDQNAKHALDNKMKDIDAWAEAQKSVLQEAVKVNEQANKQMELSDADLFQYKRFLATRQRDIELEAIGEKIAAEQRYNAVTPDDKLGKADKLRDLERERVKVRRESAVNLAQIDRDEVARQKATADASEDTVNKYLSGLEREMETAENANLKRETSSAWMEREVVARNNVALAALRENYAKQVMEGADIKEIENTEYLIGLLEKENILRGRKANALEKTEMVKIDDQNWKDVGKVGQEIAQTLAESFGKVGDAIGKMGSSLLDYAKTQHDVAKDLQHFLATTDDEPAKLRAIDDARQQSAAGQLKNYGNMASAAKGFFKEGTAGYRALEGAEKAFRVMELALAISNTVKKIGLETGVVEAVIAGSAIKKTTAVAEAGVVVGAEAVKGEAAAATAVAMQATANPYTAWVQMAAMVAAMAALGFMVGGGGGSGPSPNDAAVVQEKQGTGTVLGDSKAKSDSITKALGHLADNADMMLPLTAQMAASLRAIQSGIGGLANLSVRAGVTDSSNMNLSMKGMSLEPYGMAGGAVLGGLGGAAIGSAMTMTTIGEFAAGTSMTALGMDLGALGGPIGMVVGAIVGAIAGKLIGGTESSVTDSGLMFGGSVGQIEQSGGVQQYANVHTSSHGLTRLFSGGPSDDLKTQGVPAEIADQFAKVFQGLDSTLQTAAKALGMDADQVAAAIDSVNIASTKISLKGLTGQALTDAITNVLSSAMDQVSRAAIPGLDAFQQVGEGYAETAIRVATGVEQASVALNRFGIAAVKYTDLIDKQGDVGGEITRQSILAVEHSKVEAAATSGAIGGLLGDVFQAIREDALTGVGKIIENLHGTASDIAAVYQALLDLRKLMGDVKMNGNDLGQDIITGAGGAKNLQTGLGDYLKNYFTPAEQSAAELGDLRKEFDKLGVTMPTTKAGLRAMIDATGTATPEAAKLTGALLNLAGAFSDAMDHVDALTGKTSLRAKAESNLQAAYNKASGELNNTINRLSAWQTQLSNFGKNLMLGSDSPLTPEQKYTEAKAQYEDTVAKAKAGDENAQANFQSVAQAFLAASRTVNASDQQYQADFAQVVAMTTILKVSASSQVDIARQQLDVLKQQVKGILNVEDAVLSVAEAIRQLAIAVAQDAGSTPGAAAANTDAITKLYQDILGRLPDAAGLNYWVEQATKGTSLGSIQGAFQNSPEVQVKSLYQEVLHRAPDAAGLSYWTQAMQQGATLDQVRQAFMNSPEALDGSHATGLEAVPFDGYKAELHKGEAVVDAQAMTALRRYFGGPGGQQTDNSAALVAEIRALRAEQAKLREENAEQAAMLARVMAVVMEKNGDKVAEAVSKGQQGAAWAQQQAKRGVLV